MQRSSNESHRSSEQSSHAASHSQNQPRMTERSQPSYAASQSQDRPRTTEQSHLPYTVHATRYFRIGRVFAVRWAEPLGTSETYGPISGALINERRMVVVQHSNNASWCLPIHTYGGQGCEKSACRPEDHAAICSKGTWPDITSTEFARGLRTSVLMVRMAANQMLHSKSRLNFGKVHTIDHNVPTREIGMICDDSMDQLLEWWDEAKNRLNRQISRRYESSPASISTGKRTDEKGKGRA